MVIGLLPLLASTSTVDQPAAAPLVEAYRVVTEPSGTLLVADGGRGGGRIVRVDPATGRRTLVAGTGGTSFSGAGGSARRASLGRVTDVALGPGGSIYAVASKRVVRIGRDGRLRVVARFRAALGLAVTARRVVYVTDDEGGRVLRFDPTTRRTTTIATGLSQPIGVAVERDGAIVVSSGHDGGRVERILSGSRRETVVGGLALPAFVTAVPDGSLLVVDHVRHDARGRILRVAPGGAVSTLSDGRILAVSSAAQARDGRTYVSAFAAPSVGRLDPDTGRLVPLGTRTLAAAGPRLLSARTAVAGRPWRAIVELAGARAPKLAATLGGRTRTATLRPTSGSRWAASLTLPTAGSWRLTLRVATRTLPLGRLAVRPAPVDIAIPYKLALEPAGTLLAADGDRDRLVRVDPRTGNATVVAKLSRPLAVTAAADGTIYAIAEERLYRVDGARATQIAGFEAEGPTDVAVTPSGEIYVARYGDHVDVVSAGSSLLVARGFDRPHGITAAPDGSLVVADTYAGAVRRLMPDGPVTTLATGLVSPIDVAVDTDGSILVADHRAGRLSRIAADGTTTVVTSQLSRPSSVVVAHDGAIYAATQGPAAVVRVDRATGALTPVAR